jgi:hypothetical protein
MQIYICVRSKHMNPNSNLESTKLGNMNDEEIYITWHKLGGIKCKQLCTHYKMGLTGFSRTYYRFLIPLHFQMVRMV